MNDKFECRVLSFAVLPEGEDIEDSERKTTVSINQGHVCVSQAGGLKILIDNFEWPALRKAVEMLLLECEQPEITDRPPLDPRQ